MNKTGIQWTEYTWNPITGCTPISPGCTNCYAERMARRLAGRCGYPQDDPFSVTFHPQRLNAPRQRGKASLVFVCSMGDLFHNEVRVEWIEHIWEVMESCPLHTFQVLTKRARRMKDIVPHLPFLTNVWLGVSVESQEYAEGRIPFLLETPAAVRFISAEPLLGSIDLHWQGIDWVIAGGETGPRARRPETEWVRQLRDQCVRADIPFNFKSWGGSYKKYRAIDGEVWEQFPKKFGDNSNRPGR